MSEPTTAGAARTAAGGHFTGVPVAALDFYEALEADNSKVFWTEHKAVYEAAVRQPLTQLAAALEPEFGSGKLFRPYRDVRFSADKTPYKTHQGAWFPDSSVYLHVDAAGLFLGGGVWRSGPDEVARLRRAVDDDRLGSALAQIVTELRGAGWEIGGETLTRVPAGYPKDHPRGELMRHKTLTASRGVGVPDWLATPDAAAQIAGLWRQLARFTDWLRRHVS